jgi:Glycosyl hydrolase family 9
MTPLVLLLSLASSGLQTLDTGLVLCATRSVVSGNGSIETRIWNASPTVATDISLRLWFRGTAPEMADLGFRRLDAQHYDASLPTTTLALPAWNAPPVLDDPACTGTCDFRLDLPLTGVSIPALEGVGFQLLAGKIENGFPGYTPPAHAFGTWDWSLSAMDSTAPGSMDAMAYGHRAPRIELFRAGKRVWGNAPGESGTQAIWPLANFRSSSFSKLSRVPSDTVPVRERDLRNHGMGRWLVNQAGYRLSDVRAGRGRVLGIGTTSWNLIDSFGQSLGSGTVHDLGSTAKGTLLTKAYVNSVTKLYDTLTEGPSGELGEAFLPTNLPGGGPYRMASGSDTSAPFMVDEDLYGQLRDATLRFFGVQRSGNSSSWFHPASHQQDPVPGGWYDCGDHIKEGQTQGYAMEVLGTLAATHPERDPDLTSYRQDLETPDGTPDLVRELRHGTDFLLTAWDLSGKDPATLVTSIGSSSPDHLSWTRPEWSELLPANRGGAGGRSARKEMGSNLAGSQAAALAFAAGLQTKEDPTFAAKALEAAKAIYAWGKANRTVYSKSTNYSDNESASKMALAAVALLWVTRDTSYLHDLAFNDSLVTTSFPMWYSVKGWLGRGASGTAMNKAAWYLDYANPHPLALHSFFKLILASADPSVYGLSRARADSLKDAVMYGALANLSLMPSTDGSRKLTSTPIQRNLHVDSIWAFPSPLASWGWSRYFAGNLAEMLLYADLAREMAAAPTVRFPAGTDFGTDTVVASALRGMDYLLGQNPWSLSFLMGIGSRNLNHLSHRGANPEGSNVSSFDYPYRTPVGALAGAAAPGTLLRDEWDDYTASETCLDFAATFLIPTTLLAAKQSVTTGIAHSDVARIRNTATVRWNARTSMLAWTGATEGISYQLLDLRGRTLISSSEPTVAGERRITLPTGISLLKWHSGNTGSTLSLLRP